jgi:poly(3-hydroxyalkanoate) synthetase
LLCGNSTSKLCQHTVKFMSVVLKIPGEVAVSGYWNYRLLETSTIGWLGIADELKEFPRYKIYKSILDVGAKGWDKIEEEGATIFNYYNPLNWGTLTAKLISLSLGQAEKVTGVADLIQRAEREELEGITPYEEVDSDGFSRLLHMKTNVPEEERKKEPLVFIMPPMSKWQIIDIFPGKSLVESLGDDGQDVYVIDWGGDKLQKRMPGWENEKNKTLDHQILGSIPQFIKKASEISKSKDVNLGSYCMGVTHTAIYLAVAREVNPDINVKSAFMFTPPIDFAKENFNKLFQASTDPSLDIEGVVRANGGYMDGKMISLGTAMRNTWEYIIRPYLANQALVGDSETKIDYPLQIMKWLAQSTAFPGPMFLELQEIFRGNLLTKGEVNLEDKHNKKYNVNLGNIDTDVLMVIASKDDIVDPKQAGKEFFTGREPKTIIINAAHVNLTLGGRKNGAYAETNKWLREHSTNRN